MIKFQTLPVSTTALTVMTSFSIIISTSKSFLSAVRSKPVPLIAVSRYVISFSSFAGSFLIALTRAILFSSEMQDRIKSSAV